MRLGIFGGTFSPPHIGHVGALSAFAESLPLDKILVVPTFVPPHKEYNEEASSTERLEMARLAFSDISLVEISDMEIRRGGRSYTYLTLEELSGDGVELYFLCGTDMLLTLDTWKNFERVFSLATICFVRREGDESLTPRIKERLAEYRERWGAKIIEIKASAIEISSTELRHGIKTKNDEILRKIPDKVLSYIKERGLYL